VSAALTADRKTFTMAVLNPSDHPERMRIALGGLHLAGEGRLWRLAPDRVDATVTVGKPPEVVEQQQMLGALPDTVLIPAGSISIFSYEVR
jgi:alpha-L-arabinofuranosidase